MTPIEYLELHIQQALADLSACHFPHSWQPRDVTSYLTDALQVVQGAKRDQPPGIGDSPSVREPPPVEASPSPRERSAVGAKRPLDLCSAVSVLTAGLPPYHCSHETVRYHTDYDGAPVIAYCTSCGAHT